LSVTSTASKMPILLVTAQILSYKLLYRFCCDAKYRSNYEKVQIC